MFKSVLVANRGEIAVRVIRTVREMGLRSIAAYSDADFDALFVQEADEAYRLGPSPAAESYLNTSAILDVCRQSGAEAVHPGYGFLSENAAFAEAVSSAGLTFIGPTPNAIRRMGDKVEARRVVSGLGVPLVPGSPDPVSDVRQAARTAAEIGYPVAIKAAAGGGGRGIRVVREESELAHALETASREAQAYFRNPQVYIERYFDNPRHVEIQILGDDHGKIVHLPERECSVQRRHQKLIEETPSPAVDMALRGRMGDAAIRAAESVGYTSAGTVEFLLAENNEFYFLEMNTRLQVEHPVTEMVTGLDLVREMVLIAAGEPMSIAANVLDPYGHAIEVRINAEDPLAGFRPTPRTISRYLPPGGPGVRVDSGIYAGYAIPEFYDSLVAKVIGWGPSRARAIATVSRALREFHVEGPHTTTAFAREVVNNPEFVAGTVDTMWLERHLDRLISQLPAPPPAAGSELDLIERSPVRQFEVDVNRKRFAVSISELGVPPEQKRAQRERRSARSTNRSDVNAVLSPMHGTVVAVRKVVGDAVLQGEIVLVVEAMKMENEVPAPRSGKLSSITVSPGDTVEAEQHVATIE